MNTKSPNLNLMITPSVYDCPNGKIKVGDFNLDSDSKFNYNSNRDNSKLGCKLTLSETASNDGLNDMATLRSKSNNAHDQVR